MSRGRRGGPAPEGHAANAAGTVMDGRPLRPLARPHPTPPTAGYVGQAHGHAVEGVRNAGPPRRARGRSPVARRKRPATC